MANEVKLKLAIEGDTIVVSKLNETAQGLDKIGQSSQGAKAQLQELTGQFVTLTSTLVGVASVQKAITASSDYSALTARIALLVGSAEKAAVSMQTVYEIAQRQGASLMAVGDSYAKIGQAMTSLGGTATDTAQVVEAMAAALRLGNASTQEAASAMRQFGQAMAKGRLNGDEFVSLMENAPYLMDAIAASLGKTKGELFGMAEAGQLTAEVISNAVLSSFGTVTAKAATLPQTIGQAMENVTSSFTKAAAESKMVGLVSSLAMTTMGEAAQHAGLILDTLAKGALLALGRQVLLTVQAFTTQTSATMAASAANVLTLQTTLASAEAKVIYTGIVLKEAQATLASATGLGASVVAQNALMAATLASTAATVAQTEAQVALNAATSLGGRALSLLGGPIGAITAVLGLGMTAWSLWGGSAKDAEEKASVSIEKSTKDIVADLNNQIEHLERRNALAGKKLAGLNNGFDLNSPASDKWGALQIEIDALNKKTAGSAREQVLIYEQRNRLLSEQGQITQSLVALEQKRSPERLRAQQESYTAAMAKYAPEVDKATAAINEERKALGAAFSPELEARIKAHFATKKQGVKDDVYAAEATQLYASTMDGLAKAQESASAKADGLSKAQEALRTVQASPHWAQYNRQMQEQIIYAASLTQAEEDREAAKKLLLKAQADQNVADQKAADSLHTEISGLRDSNAAMELRNQEIGLTTEAFNALTLKRIDDQIAVQAGIVLDGERLVADGYVIASLQEQINKLDELKKKRDLTAAGQTATVAADESKKAKAEWDKTSESINTSLTDALMRGFESGKGFAVNLRDTVVNMFKTMVLRPVISAVMNPIAQGLTGAMGLTSTASAASGIGNAGTALSGIAALAGNFGAGIAEGFATAWGTGGSLSGALSMGSGMMGSGSLAGGFGAVVGALGPIAIGIGALVAISKATAGEMRSGGQYTYNPITGTQFAQGPSGGQINGAEVTTAISGTVESINRLLTSYGSASRLSGFVAGLESSGDNRGGVMAGGTLSTGGTFGQSGRGSVYDGTMYDPSKSFNMSAQEAATAFALELQQSVIKAMQNSDLPAYLQKVFRALDANTMTADQITNTLAFASSLQQVRDALLETRQPLQILQDNVAAGFATLATSATTFKADFVAAIDAGISPANLAAWQSLGATMDQLAASTKEANDALIASQDQLAAKVLSAQTALNSAQAGVVSALRSISDNVLALADAAKQSAAGVDDARNAISQGYWDAQDAMLAAQAKVNDLTREATDKLKAFGQTITDFLAGINPATSSTASLQSLKAQLSATSVLAGGGDTGAQSKVVAQAQAVLKAAEASSTSRVDYARTEAFVRQTLEGVQKAITPIANATAAPTITPMESALTELKAAQLRVVEFAAVAAVTGANTDRSTAATAMSSQGLWDSFKAAQTVNDAAQNAYATALTLTAGLALTQTGTLNGLMASLSGLGKANSDLTTAQAALTAAQTAANVTVTAARDAFALTTTGADLLTTALGLTGTEAAALRLALTTPSTAAGALATVLSGLSDVQLAAFGTALGTSPITTFTGALTTGQIDLFKGALTTTELGLFTGALTTASTTVGNGAVGVFFGVNGVLTTAATGLFTTAQTNINSGAGGVFTGVNGSVMTGANGVFTGANGQIVAASGGVFTGINGVLATNASGTFTGVNGAVVTASNGVFTGVNGNIVGLSSGLFTGVNGAVVTGAGGAFAGVNTTLSTAASTISGVLTGLLTPEQALAFQTTLSNSGLSADALATSLGLSGGAAATFAGSLVTPITNATTLATYLGQAGDAASAFAALVGGLQLSLPETGTKAPGTVTTIGGVMPDGTVHSASIFTEAQALTMILDSLNSGYTVEDIRLGGVRNWGFALADINRIGHAAGVPGFAVGTNSVPYDMTARVHAGEEITPRPYVDRQAQERAETNRLLAALLKSNAELKAEVAALKKPMTDTASATERSKDIAEQVAIGGLSNQTRIVTA